MAKLLSISTDALTSSSGSSYINKTDIYDVVIKFASVEQSKSGATQVNFNVDYNGNTQAIYGPYIASKDGTPISMGVRFLTELGIISGLEEGEDLTTVEESFKVGKDNKEKDPIHHRPSLLFLILNVLKILLNELQFEALETI